ncbi:hypothetical protein [Streptomyces sp. Agncl-13]|uniref:hypothetical protein n=1 Tax=Streptomyces sp. Agncl-13 TaxID=3400628 RepID=UPI003A861BAE
MSDPGPLTAIPDGFLRWGGSVAVMADAGHAGPGTAKKRAARGSWRGHAVRTVRPGDPLTIRTGRFAHRAGRSQEAASTRELPAAPCAPFSLVTRAAG